MRTLNLASFTVGGQSSGGIRLPCNPGTTIPIEMELTGILSAREAPGPVNVPILIGEKHWFWDITLISSYATFSGSAGTPLTASANFTLYCSPLCRLTPAGSKPPTSLRVPPWLNGMAPWIISVCMFFTWTYVKIIFWLFPKLKGGKLTRYVVDGNKMIISCAYYDNANVPFFRWWYGNQRVTVVCGGKSPE